MDSFWDSSPASGFVSEADVEQRLILPLLYSLGYKTDDIESKKSVIFQQGRSKGRKPEADFVCYSDRPHDLRTSLIVVETKAPGESLADAKDQGESYAFNLRAPILMITDGDQLEVWQLQPTMESEKILDLPVRDLIRSRGSLENLLSKQALISLCDRLKVKSLIHGHAQHKEYLAQEAARVSKHPLSIPRTLSKRESKLSVPSQQLFEENSGGAIILAPSGFGKSTFGYQIMARAIEEREANCDARLPFFVPLPSIGSVDGSLLKFLVQRVKAHSPGFTEAALSDTLRTCGAVLICDTFDRVPASARAVVLTELANILRDFPLIQIVVFSRPSFTPDLPLPIFDLGPPTDEELRDLEVLVLGSTRQAAYVVSMMPKTLRNLCENALVARLVFEYWKQNRRYPIQLDTLFRSWIDALLGSSDSLGNKRVWLESALTLLAESTVAAPVEATVALDRLMKQHLDSSLIDDLMERDAIHANGIWLDLQHEALADYLRARKLASLPEAELVDQFQTISIAKDSLFLTLLISQLPSRDLQGCLWKRISEADFGVYLDALRYRFDLSEELGNLDEHHLSYNYLEDLLDGIELPMDAFFPALRRSVERYLTLSEELGTGITGIVAGPPVNEVAYGFRAIDGVRIAVAQPQTDERIHSTAWLHLGRSGYRLDSGRLLGAGLLRDTLLKLVEKQEMEGGPYWLSERLIGRIWHLQRAHQLALDEAGKLDELENALQPESGKWVPYGDRQSDWFSIDSLLVDIRTLKTAGHDRLDLWWRECGWNPTLPIQADEVMTKVLSEFYRRKQFVLREVIERTFPLIAESMACYTSLPERWEITLLSGVSPFGFRRMWARWQPVRGWEDAGADILFADHFPVGCGDGHLRKALQEFGRPAQRYFIETTGPIPSFEGYWVDGRSLSTTAIVREVCGLVKSEIKYLFSQLSSHELILS
jgi:hypothetical protein